MTVLFGIAVIALFVLAFGYSGLVPAASGAVAQARSANQAMADKKLDDLEKEKIVQQSALKLFGSFGSILLRSIVVLAVSGIPIFLADVTGLATSGDVIGWLARWDVIVIASIVVAGLVWLVNSKWRRK